MNTRFRFRLVYRTLLLRRGRVSLALLALTTGAALASALLSTYAELERKMAGQFRRYGANLVVAPPPSTMLSPTGSGETLPADALAAVERAKGSELTAVPFLYVVGQVNDRRAVLAGTDFQRLRPFSGAWQLHGFWPSDGRSEEIECLAGARLGLRPGDNVKVGAGNASRQLRVSGALETGASEDSQLLLPLPVLEMLTGPRQQGRLSLIEVSAPPEQVEAVRVRLSAALPGTEVRILRPVAEGTARVLLKVRGLLFATSAVILAIVGLGVMTTLSAIVLRRQKDIGLMKALGASQAHIAALFVAESALLGVAAGLAGFFAGLFLSQWISHSIYQARLRGLPEAAPARLAEVLALTVAVSIASTLLPLRMVRDVDPAMALKGE